MAFGILITLIGVPLLEIAIFIRLGEAIGLWWTLGIIVLTAVVGTALLRWQGLDTLRRARAAFGRGQLPMAEVLDGLFLLIAGVLLLTPGFFTDVVGFSLFIPPIRALLRALLLARIVQAGTRRAGARSASDGSTIDGTYDVVEPETDEPEPHRPRLPPNES